MSQSDAPRPHVDGISGTTPAAFAPPGPIHHIGIVVEDIAAAVAAYRALGFAGGEVTRVAEQNVDIAALRAGESWIEILAPVERDSPIGSYLQKRGPGFHHIAYLVDDLAGTLRALDADGVELIDRAPRVGLHGWLVAFVHPRACAGVLSELVERDSVAGHQRPA
ncbi:MAG TPA: methylmalonyl-CoA epimerase [Thermomicrobiales bacterium]|nr:methylmalonyl-CoA epimerase [Thermomicrobiales bacterium]